MSNVTICHVSQVLNKSNQKERHWAGQGVAYSFFFLTIKGMKFQHSWSDPAIFWPCLRFYNCLAYQQTSG